MKDGCQRAGSRAAATEVFEEHQSTGPVESLTRTSLGAHHRAVAHLRRGEGLARRDGGRAVWWFASPIELGATMGGYRQPGSTDVMATAPPIDAGTLAQTTSPRPGTIGIGSTRQLSDHELTFIRNTVGRAIGGSRLPVEKLQFMRELSVDERAQAARQFGPESGAVLFLQATVDRLDELIEEARSPFGSATEQVRSLIQEVRTSGSASAEQRLRKALEVLLGMERQRQLLGMSDDSSDTNKLLGDALNAAADRRNGVLQSLIEKAKRDRRSVTDEQLRSAMVEVLDVERQRQVLGISQPGDNEAMELVNEAATLRGPGAAKVSPPL